MKISYDAVRTLYTLPYLINNNLSPMLRACCCRGLRYTTGRTFAWNGPRRCAFRDWPALYGHGVLGYGGLCVSRVGLRMHLHCAQSCSWVSFESQFCIRTIISPRGRISHYIGYFLANFPPHFPPENENHGWLGWRGPFRTRKSIIYRLGTCYTYLGTNSTKFWFEIQ